MENMISYQFLSLKLNSELHFLSKFCAYRRLLNSQNAFSTIYISYKLILRNIVMRINHCLPIFNLLQELGSKQLFKSIETK